MPAATRAELTKIVSLRTVWIVTGVVITLHLLVSFANVGLNTEAVSKITPTGLIELFPDDPQPAHRAIVDFLVASSFQMGLFLPGIAAVIAGQEFRSRQLGQSLLAVPRRGRLIVAKTFAATGFLLFVSVLIAGISTAFMYAAVKDWNPTLLVSADAWRGQGKFVAFAVLTGLISFAITVLARSTLVGIVVTVALIALTMTQLLAAFTPALDALLPLSAGRNLLLNPADNKLSAGPEHALAVLIAWPVVMITAAGIALSRRDAR
ncbi:ABC transporter permease [Sinosporangium album]|uniref:ABC transporter permease n=1 Tax=Sinosporangium album TaxID=504805 RepID=UPI00115FEC0C|nr:ABC transporter permease [Sinosporangium album]